MTYRSQVVKQAQAWLGRKESDGTHKLIIDIYNSYSPLPRGYKMSYKDAWCAAFVSAVAIKCDATNIIPVECSCNRMIDGFKKLGEWQESDSYVPKPADVIFYDWDDSGSGDNKNEADHVGIVESCDGTYIKAIEGNYSDAVRRRTLKVNGKYIRGFGLPKYASEPVVEVKITLNELSLGMTGKQVKTMQQLLIANGYGLPKYGADSEFGSESETALKRFQKDHGLDQDGVCGINTWTKLLKG